MIPAPFEYIRAGSIDEALDALADPDAKVLAGGHSLVPLLKLRVVRPSLLVDIGGLDLRGVDANCDTISVGALTTYEDFARGGEDAPDVLRECAAAVGDLQVRNHGTLGGGVAHGDPASDVAAAVLALEATLRLRSKAGTRECAAGDFFRGPFTTALEQQELLTEIVVPRAQAGEGSAYASVEDPASGYALAGAAVLARVENGALASCAVAITGAAAQPLRLRETEAALLGGAGTVDAVEQTLSGLELPLDGADADYRRHVIAVVVTRALHTARARAERGAAT